LPDSSQTLKNWRIYKLSLHVRKSDILMDWVGNFTGKLHNYG
jgi:hypothetical protein